MPDDLTTQQADKAWFLLQLRTALNGLYDPAVLGHSPLARLFRLDQRCDKIFALRDILTSAIEASQPRANEPADSRHWREYQVLRSRYIEQLPQPQVAADLNLSLRQLQREESSARTVLADYLWTAHDLAGRTADIMQMAADKQAAASGGEAPAGAGAHADGQAEFPQDPFSLRQELEALSQSAPATPTDIGEVIEKALETIRPLTEAVALTIEFPAAWPLLRLNLQAAVLRQAVIGVINAVAGCAHGGRAQIQAQVAAGRLNIDIRILGAAPAGPPEEECLQITRELLSLSGGALEIRSPTVGEVFAARLTLPVSQPAVVLIVDDNADTLQLFRRYLSGSRYQLVAAQSGRQALTLIESLPPDIIVLDVMMPEQDGWMLLGQLRENPRTRAVPIIICTIVPQEQLALLLGAAQFLRKPVSRAALLGALDHQLARSPS
ncbi:MAG: hypothetical protein QG637_91 [Chloroflexota bacterium]|nr:hypothetical protein [Chloroflexota bacterium]